MSIVKEFREFAIKGNFIDLAVGVIIGAASGKVVTALVEKVIMPPIGLITGKVNFTELRYVLQPAVFGPDGKEFLSFVGVFVASVGLGYLWALWRWLRRGDTAKPFSAMASAGSKSPAHAARPCFL